MDLGRANPRLGTRGKVLDDIRGPLKLAGRMVYRKLWLSEQNAGRDDAGQEGEDQGRVRTRGGAHPGAQRSREGARKSL